MLALFLFCFQEREEESKRLRLQKLAEEAEKKRVAAEAEQRKNQRILQEIQERDRNEAIELLLRTKKKGKKPVIEGVRNFDLV